MADDQNQRPYRSNEPPVRRAAAVNPASGSDPLAELARLIGQSDPFAEHGRDTARRATAPPAYAPADEPPPFVPPRNARQPYAAGDRYPPERETMGHSANAAGGFEPVPYDPSNAQYAAEEEDYYDDAPPPKRRMGIMAIAAVFALAVLGTAGAFGYRAIFGASRSATPPPVIKADAAPSKIVPATASKTPNKLIYDQVADHAQGEKLVSREEQPVEMKRNPAAAPMTQAQGAPPAALGSGVISSEPKKIHTIAIRPDEASTGNQPVSVTAAPAVPPLPTRMAAPAPVKQASPPPRVASTAPPAAVAEPPQPQQTEARANAPAHRSTASVPNNAPLSLSPNAPAAPAARAPIRTAAVAAPARTAQPASGNYAVQVSSQRSEAEAQAAFRNLQAKYPNQLGGRQSLIHKVELGDKGTYYRAMVGPFASANEASELCNSLKTAGGQCLVQRN